MNEPTTQLASWARQVLDYGFDCYKDGEGDPLVMIVQGQGQLRVRELQGLARTDAAAVVAVVEAGRGLVREFSDAHKYAFFYEGYVNSGGELQNSAIMAEVGIVDEAIGWIVAQPVRPKKRGIGWVKIGSPLVVSKTPQLMGNRRKQLVAKKRKAE